MLEASLRYFRKKQGLTQKQLAERLNVSLPQVQKYETGRTPLSTERIAQLVEIFQIDPADLFIPQLESSNNNTYTDCDEDFEKLKMAYYRIKTAPLRKKAVAAISLIASDPNNR